MRRFHKGPVDQYGNVIIFDLHNSEPVCLIYGKYHSDKVDLIFNALDQSCPEADPKILAILGIKEQP